MFAKLVRFSSLTTSFQIHPYAKIAWTVVSSVYKVHWYRSICLTASQHHPQVIQHQRTTDKKLLDLVDTMENVYSFVDAVQAITKKLGVLESVIKQIFAQTVECSIFI